MSINRFACMLTLVAATVIPALCQTEIPAAAWRIPIGTAPPTPAHSALNSTAATSTTATGRARPWADSAPALSPAAERGHFERWHIKAGTHKYQDVPTNQFAVFAQPEGGTPVSMALAVGKPEDGALGSWNWNYPAGDGEYAALYPKSWFSYGTKALPVKLTVEQFSPVLPNNYKETSYPVAVYRWTAENPTSKAYDRLDSVFVDQHGGLVSRPLA